MRLRYKNNTEKNQLSIDYIGTHRDNQNYSKDIENHFTEEYMIDLRFIKVFNELYISCVIPVDFYIYKPHNCWIKIRDHKIQFRYTIKPHPTLKLEYILEFDFSEFSKQPNILIPVKDCCYPKKALIKYLLNYLFTNNIRFSNYV